MNRLVLLAGALTLFSYSGYAEHSAFLRFANDKAYVAIYADVPNAEKIITTVKAAVFHGGKLVADEVKESDIYGSTFTIPLPAKVKPWAGKFYVAVFQDPSELHDTDSSGFLISVKPSLTVRLLGTDNPQCEKGEISILVSGNNETAISYVTHHLELIITELKKNGVNVSKRVNGGKYGKTVRVSTELSRLGKQLSACFAIPKPPNKIYDVLIAFNGVSSPYLRGREFEQGIQREVGPRTLKRNLEFGVQFSSFLEDVMQESPTSSRERSNVGTFDLWFAPFLNEPKSLSWDSNAFFFSTPFFADARISTEQINEKTISQNRINLGSVFEFRNYSNPSTNPGYQRYLISLENSSDRDFKQAEVKAKFEFQPVFSILNQPLRWNLFAVKTGDGVRIKQQKIGFGYQFLPTIGVELGRIWRDTRPLTAIEKAETVRRIFFGGTLNLDITSYLRVVLDDLLYIRGESVSDRYHNHFECRVEAPLPSWKSWLGNAIFFSFERGGKPPFSTPDVNALRLGYLLQVDYQKKR